MSPAGGTRAGRILRSVPAYLVIVFLVAPLVVVAATSFTSGALVEFPPRGFSLRWYVTAFGEEQFLEGLAHSAWLAAISTAFALVIGYVAALAITRNPRGARLVNVIALGPLFVSSAVLGLAFLIILSKIGMLGNPFGVLVAYIVITLPFTTRMIAGVLAGQGTDAEIAARVYGAGRLRAIMGVTIPLSAQGVFTAAVYSFVHAFDESVIINFIGSVRYQTFPGVMIARLRETFDPVASVYSTLILAVTIVVVVLAARLFGLDRLSGGVGGRDN
ncbi:MAG: ABC transporter permease [Microbacterium sp.]|uniref:ABC transporter permease n=1 Tax=Microbacterium sp. TaxID=51671 RepID=UPI0039E43479